MAEESPPPHRLLDLVQVRELVPFSAVQIWRLERAGLFPRRVRIGPNRVAWAESEVLAWIEDRLASRWPPPAEAGKGWAREDGDER